MKLFWSVLFCSLFFCFSLKGQRPIDTLIAMEKKFAATSSAFSTKKAFLAFVDSSAAGYNEKGRPVNIFNDWTQRTEDSSKLSWAPGWALISSSGDLGITTGPWEYRSTRIQENADAHGHFTSVWKKNSSGVWKVLFDMGISYPEHTKFFDTVEANVSVIKNRGDVNSRGTSPEDQFISNFKKEGINTFSTVIDESSWLNINQHTPCRGKEITAQCLAFLDNQMRFFPEGYFVPDAKDILVIYGTVSLSTGQKQAYLRVWQLKQPGEWKLVMMVLH